MLLIRQRSGVDTAGLCWESTEQDQMVSIPIASCVQLKTFGLCDARQKTKLLLVTKRQGEDALGCSYAHTRLMTDIGMCRNMWWSKLTCSAP